MAGWTTVAPAAPPPTPAAAPEPSQTPAPQAKGWTMVAPPAPSPRAEDAPKHGSVSPLEAPIKTAAAGLQHGLGLVGTALDFQRAATQEAIFHGGSSDENRSRLRDKLGVNDRAPEDPKNPVGNVLNHLVYGATDTALDTIADPLTYETMGAGPFLRAIGVAGKVGPAALRVMDATPLGRKLYDFTHWGGAVARERGPEAVAELRGAANKASSTGMRVQQHLVRRFDTVTSGLSDAEKVRVGKALNGEGVLPGEEGVLEGGAAHPDALTPKEASAYRQLRALTEMDYKMRTDVARTIEFNKQTRDLSPEDRQTLTRAFAQGKEPTIPAPTARVRPPYGEPVERSRAVPIDKKPDLKTVYDAETAGLSSDDKAALHKAWVAGLKGAEAHEPMDYKSTLRRTDYEDSPHKDVLGADGFHAIYSNDNTKFAGHAIVIAEGPGSIPHLMQIVVPQNARGGAREILEDVRTRLLKQGYDKIEMEPISESRKRGAQAVFGKPISENGNTVVYSLTSNAAKSIRAMRLSPDLQGRLTRIQDAASGQFGPGNTQVIKLKDAQRTTFMPGNQAAIDKATMLNQRYHDIAFHVEQAMPKREHYMPWAHDAATTEDRAAKTIDTTEHYDPRAEHREDIHVTKPEQLAEGFNAMAKNTGRQVKTGEIHKALGDLLDDPEIHKLFEDTLKATGAKRTDADKIKDAWLKVIGYPRAATVSMTPRHALNIMDLAANTVPPQRQAAFFADTIALAKKIATAKDAKEYAALTKEGRDLGALSGEFSEREPFFQKIPSWVPGVGGKSTGPLGAYTRLNNKLVWAIDEAAKQTYAKMLVETGEASGLRAGGMASSRLVDYEHVSPMVKKLRYLAPFGTFRGSIPGAVIGGIARNPARAALLNRATGGTMYGGKPPPGKHGMEVFNPTADVSRGLEAPQEYLRSTLGAPVQAAATMAEEALTGEPGASISDTVDEAQALPKEVVAGKWHEVGRPRKGPYAQEVALRHARYLNYGNPVDLRWLLGAAAGGVVEARDALEQIGAGQFQPNPGSLPQRLGTSAVQQATGVISR